VIDGGLRGLFQRHLLGWHWQAIETGGTGRGVADLNGCCDGREVWLEMKQTSSWKVSSFYPEQVAWAERRARAGGRVLVAVRQTGRERDDLWLLAPGAARLLIDRTRLDKVPSDLLLGRWEGGPARWDWDGVCSCLVGT
jgi:hypothetical protein